MHVRICVIYASAHTKFENYHRFHLKSLIINHFQWFLMIMKAEKLLFPTKQLFLWKKVVTSCKKHDEVENCLNFSNKPSSSEFEIFSYYLRSNMDIKLFMIIIWHISIGISRKVFKLSKVNAHQLWSNLMHYKICHANKNESGRNGIAYLGKSWFFFKSSSEHIFILDSNSHGNVGGSRTAPRALR